MTSNTYSTYIFLIVIFCAATCHAAEKNTSHAYLVTSYNLGAILDYQQKKSIFESDNFNPLMITSTNADILNNEFHPSVFWGEVIPHTSSSKGIALSAQYEATKKITVLGAFGITQNLRRPDNLDEDNESSWEANLGFIYKLVNNFSYELHLGYMDTGNLFRDQSSYSDVENIIMVSNQLTMSF